MDILYIHMFLQYILIFAWIGAVWVTCVILCFSWVRRSVYMRIMFVSVVYVDSSVGQTNVWYHSICMVRKRTESLADKNMGSL